mmetsp:Transcript_16809/g.50898  ORF Transcript_16809/g.50898 Transcript_16809/m.50898 type:complete len:266 (-) Transcript_16809:215-1012(-)
MAFLAARLSHIATVTPPLHLPVCRATSRHNSGNGLPMPSEHVSKPKMKELFRSCQTSFHTYPQQEVLIYSFQHQSFVMARTLVLRPRIRSPRIRVRSMLGSRPKFIGIPQASPRPRAKRVMIGTGWSWSRTITWTREPQPEPPTKIKPSASVACPLPRPRRSSLRVYVIPLQQQQQSLSASVLTARSDAAMSVNTEEQKQQPHGKPPPRTTLVDLPSVIISRVSKVIFVPHPLTLRRSGRRYLPLACILLPQPPIVAGSTGVKRY